MEGQVPSNVRALEWDRDYRVHGGEPVTLIGHPRTVDTSWVVTTGSVSGVGAEEIFFDAKADEGNSGGPLLYNGKVIGVVTQLGQFGSAKPALIAYFTLENWHIFSAVPREPINSPTVRKPTPPSNSHLGSVTIDSTPSGAEVYLDGDLVGATGSGPVTLNNLVPDQYDIEVIKQDFAVWEDSVNLAPGQQASLHASLQKQTHHVSGMWSLNTNPNMIYVFTQEGERVTLQVIQGGFGGGQVTAQGEGEWAGSTLNVEVRASADIFQMARMTMSVQLSPDGTLLSGTLRGGPGPMGLPISLSKVSNQGEPFPSLRPKKSFQLGSLIFAHISLRVSLTSIRVSLPSHIVSFCWISDESFSSWRYWAARFKPCASVARTRGACSRVGAPVE